MRRNSPHYRETEYIRFHQLKPGYSIQTRDLDNLPKLCFNKMDSKRYKESRVQRGMAYKANDNTRGGKRGQSYCSPKSIHETSVAPHSTYRYPFKAEKMEARLLRARLRRVIVDQGIYVLQLVVAGCKALIFETQMALPHIFSGRDGTFEEF